MTINKKVLVLMVVLLAAITVQSVNATDLSLNIESGSAYTVDLGTITDNQVSLTLVIDTSNMGSGGFIRWGYSLNDMHSFALRDNPLTITLPSNQTSVTVYTNVKYNMQMSRVIESSLTIDYNYAEPTPEPTPTGPYLKATPMFYDVTFVSYQISTEPSNQGYEFSRITTTPQDNQFTNPQWSPAQSIIYSIPRGETITFYSKVRSWFNSATLSLSITAPKGQEDNIINETAPEVKPNNTAYNPPPIPKVTPGSKDNPVNSGKFKPSNSNSNYITPFTQFTANVKEFMQLPQMDNPQKIKSEILNTTGGNLTAPLYESIDGFTNLLCFPAYFVSDSINAALSPIEETINYCDDVLIVILGSVSEFFLSIDTLKSFFYLLIPDFVWWIICTILIFDIIATIMSFIYGRSITFYYLFGFNDKKD